mgnify:FL=1|tara:strand:- start:785 stop:1099 length:315 start_codon:yes stop_codon:yes gene_type:complete
MNKLRSGDQVFVISGKDKGTLGTLTKMISERKCYVSGVKIVKKHTKPNPQAGIEGGIIEKESPVNTSNLAIYNPSTKKPDKVGMKILEDGSKIRIYKSSGKEIK